jgi:anti-anti-sigma factor
VKSPSTGNTLAVEETTGAPAGAPAPGEPDVRTEVRDGVLSLTLGGELSEAARRPLVRILTEELLSKQPLRRVELQLGGIRFMNSAGMAVLVQLQRMAAPRGVDVALVTPSAAVARPLQLSGLWHRFPVVDENGDEDGAGLPPAGPDGSPREHS